MNEHSDDGVGNKMDHEIRTRSSMPCGNEDELGNEDEYIGEDYDLNGHEKREPSLDGKEQADHNDVQNDANNHILDGQVEASATPSRRRSSDSPQIMKTEASEMSEAHTPLTPNSAPMTTTDTASYLFANSQNISNSISNSTGSVHDKYTSLLNTLMMGRRDEISNMLLGANNNNGLNNVSKNLLSNDSGVPSLTSTGILMNNNNCLDERMSDHFVEKSPSSSISSASLSGHPLFGHNMCKWPGCELVFDDLQLFAKYD